LWLLALAALVALQMVVVQVAAVAAVLWYTVIMFLSLRVAAIRLTLEQKLPVLLAPKAAHSVQLLVVVVLVFPGLVNRGVLLAEHTLLDMPGARAAA